MAAHRHCQLLVLGSGAAGLGAAVAAAHLGLQVCVAEKAPWFGGTTAWSGGWLWVPCLNEGPEAPRRYLQHLLGQRYDAARIDAYLAQGPRMVEFFRRHTALQFVAGDTVPDFHGLAPGAASGGRSVCAAPFDAARLGPALWAQLRPPRDILAFWGMSIGADLRHFFRAHRAADSLAYVARRVARHAWDLLRHGQGRQRMGGNALVAALLATAAQRGVALQPRHHALALLHDGAGRVTGARVATPGGEVHFHASHGVLLACGGFPHDTARKAALFPHAPTGAEHWSAAPPENSGDGLRLAEALGAQVSGTLADAGAWAPVSLVPRPGGAVAAFPHLAERGKPGLIAVDASGRRFGNEAGNYHSLMRALFAQAPAAAPGRPVQAWLLCDHRFQRRWGLGHSKPRPLPLGEALRSGYLQRAPTLAALARRCGIHEAGLLATVAAYNHHAALGHDPQFHRGETPYDRMQGDPEHPGPNPCVAPLVQPPFYALRIVPGSLGTFAGLQTDPQARVLDAMGRPIAGLYAAGNDMASVMGGHYPSGGITLGPALTFAYIAAHHAAGVPLETPP